MKFKLIFFGTNHFSRLILEKLVNECSHEITAIVTQPADEKELKKNIYNHEVLSYSSTLGISTKILTPDKASDHEFLEKIKELEPDLIIVASYGQILKPALLDIPKYGCVNIHPSLLPHLRGASPVQSIILNGETETGITFIKMTPGMDDGPVLFQKRYSIESNWTSVEALDYLGKASAQELVSVLNRLNSTNDLQAWIASGKEQDDAKATFCPLIKKEMGEVKPEIMTIAMIINMYKAFQPWPGIYVMFNNKRIKLVNISIQSVSSVATGSHIFVNMPDNKTLLLKATYGFIEIKNIQTEGKNVITGEEFIRGYLK